MSTKDFDFDQQWFIHGMQFDAKVKSLVKFFIGRQEIELKELECQVMELQNSISESKNDEINFQESEEENRILEEDIRCLQKENVTIEKLYFRLMQDTDTKIQQLQLKITKLENPKVSIL